jgi:hypothetical protein
MITQAGRQFAQRVEDSAPQLQAHFRPFVAAFIQLLIVQIERYIRPEYSQTRREAGTQSLRSRSTDSRDSGVAGAEAGFEIATTCQSAKQPAKSARADDRVRCRPTPMLRLMTSCEQQGFYRIRRLNVAKFASGVGRMS